MISTPTVLILGAGASAEYGFPATRFRDGICALEWNQAFLSLLEQMDVTGIKEFIQTFCWSGYSSHNRFLEDYPEFVTPGKFCIAKVLVEREDEKMLKPPHGPNPSWYELLINKLDLGSDSYSDNRLTLISFNYDRSFEHYLWRVINARLQPEQIEAVWNQRPQIIHVHGLLGPYDPLGGSGRPYDRSSEGDSLVAAANGIRIIHEVNDQDEVFDAAEKALRGAARIYFLGFGFDERNIDRLRIFRQPLPENVEVAGTRLYTTIRQWQEIVAREAWMRGAQQGHTPPLGSGSAIYPFGEFTIYSFLSEKIDL